MFLKMDMKKDILLLMLGVTIVSGILADESLIINPVAPGLVSHCLLSQLSSIPAKFPVHVHGT